MSNTLNEVNPGLDGVVVARTALSEVAGEAGRLIVRGHAIAALTGQVRFEEMAALLWEGLAPQPPGDLGRALGRARLAAWECVAPLLDAAAGLTAIAALRLGLSSLRRVTADGGQAPADAVLSTAAMPVFTSAFSRRRRGLAPVPPDPSLGHAADFLRMLRGEAASAPEASALDAYLVTVAEHGMNASTFTARVVASTRAGVLPSVIAALCALEGPLHGGAPGPVLDMLDAVAGGDGDGDAAGAWIAGELAAGRRLMGFGHRIYRVRDPRADVLKRQIALLRAAAPAAGGRLALAERVESAALAALAASHPGRRLDTNVEFYTAVLLDALGIDRDLFTSIFAAGRVAGWIAHVFEQERVDRLIRPQSEYIGPRPAPSPSPA